MKCAPKFCKKPAAHDNLGPHHWGPFLLPKNLPVLAHVSHTIPLRIELSNALASELGIPSSADHRSSCVLHGV